MIKFLLRALAFVTNKLPKTEWKPIPLCHVYAKYDLNAPNLVGHVSAPSVTSSGGNAYSATGVTVMHQITDTGGENASVIGVAYFVGTSGDPTTADSVSSQSGSFGSGAGSIREINVTGLSPGTTYRMRAYATNSGGTGYSTSFNVTTQSLGPPTVVTNAPTSITTTSATANGNISATNGATVTERGFVWSTSADPTKASNLGIITQTGSFSTGTFTGSITGLSPSTLYYVRAYAINSYGTNYGSNQTFSTSAVPTVRTVGQYKSDLTTVVPTEWYTGTSGTSETLYLQAEMSNGGDPQTSTVTAKAEIEQVGTAFDNVANRTMQPRTYRNDTVQFAKRGGTMVYDSHNKRYIFFGGYDGTTRYNQVWEKYMDVPGQPWNLLTVSGTPPVGRNLHAMTYVKGNLTSGGATRAYAVVWGGADPNDRNDMWALRLDTPGSEAWTQITQTNAPTVRSYVGNQMVATPGTDSSNNYIYLFGGWAASRENQLVRCTFDVDTPTAITWTTLKANGAAGNPTARSGALLDYKASTGQLLLYGGNTGSMVNDFWIYTISSNTWAQRTVSGTAFTAAEAMAGGYDAINNRFWVTGGWTTSGNFSTSKNNIGYISNVGGSEAYVEVRANDTANQSYPGLSFPGNTVDPDKGWLVIFQEATVDSTERYDYIIDFRETATSDFPVYSMSDGEFKNARDAMSSALNTDHNEWVQTGGFEDMHDNATIPNGTHSGDVWSYNVTQNSWRYAVKGFKALPQIEGSYSCYDTTRDRIIVFGALTGATKNGNDVWSLTRDANGNYEVKQLRPTGTRPSPRWLGFAVFDEANNRAIFGLGGDNSGPANNVWALNFSGSADGAWTQLSPTGTVTGVIGMAFGVAKNAKRVYIHGGATNGGLTTISTQTAYFDYSTTNGAWTTITTTNALGRRTPAADFDEANNTFIVYGGYDGTNVSAATSTLNLNTGTAWNHNYPVTYPAARRSVIGQLINNKFYIDSGRPSTGTWFNDTWEYTPDYTTPSNSVWVDRKPNIFMPTFFTFTGGTSGQTYHWQTWITEGSTDSTKVSHGANSESTADFILGNAPPAVTPTVTSSAASDITPVSATANGAVTNLGYEYPSERGIVYSLASSADPTVSTNLGKVPVAGDLGSFSAPLTGLSPSTQYKYRAYATNSAGTGYSSVQTFTTSAYNPATFTLIASISNTGGGTTYATLYNRTKGLALTELSTTSSTPTLVTQDYEVGATNFHDGDEYEIRVRTNGTGTANLYSAKLYIRLHELKKVTTWNRISRFGSAALSAASATTSSRFLYESAKYSNPKLYWELTGQEDIAGTNDFAIYDVTTTDQGTTGSVYASTRVDVNSASKLRQRVDRISLTNNNRYMGIFSRTSGGARYQSGIVGITASGAKGTVNTQTIIEIADIGRSSQAAGTFTPLIWRTPFNPLDVDNATYYFEAIGRNINTTTAYNLQLLSVNGSGTETVISTLTLPANTGTSNTRWRSPAITVPSDTTQLRVRLPQTASDKQVVIEGARLIISQTNANRTLVHIPLGGSLNEENTDTGWPMTATTQSTFGQVAATEDQYTIWKRDDSEYDRYVGLGKSPTVVQNTADASSQGTNPVLQFTGTDPEGNDITYQTQVSNVSTMDEFLGNSNMIISNVGGVTGDLTAIDRAQSFTTTSAGNITRLRVFLSRFGSPTDGVQAKIYTNNAGVPGTLITTSTNTIALADMPLSSQNGNFKEAIFTFPENQSLSNATRYWFVIDRTGAASSTNYYSVEGSSATDYGTEDGMIWNGSSWAATGVLSLVFETYMVPTQTVYDDVSGVDLGFSGTPDNTSPFASGQQVSYTPYSGASPAALADGTYYWRVRGKDTGSGLWGEWSTTRSFNVTGVASYTKSHGTSAVKGGRTTKVHTTSANIKKANNTLSHTTSAAKHTTATLSHTTNSLLRKASTVSHTTSAVKGGRFTKTHTTSAVKRKQFTLAHTTDTLKHTTPVLTHSTSSLKRKAVTVSHATDANKKKQLTVSHTTNALRRLAPPVFHTTSANKRAIGTKTHTTSANIKRAYTKTHTTSANLKRAYTVAHTTSANRRALSTKSHSTSSVVRKQFTSTHLTDALKRKATVVSHSTNSVLNYRYTLSHSTDARIAMGVQTMDISHSTDAFKRTQPSLSHTTSSVIRKSNTLSHTTSANKKRSYTASHTTSANRKKAFTLAHTTSANKKVANNVRVHNTDALKRKQFTLTHSTDTLKRVQSTLSHTTDSLKNLRSTLSHTTDALKRKVFTLSHSADSNKKRADNVVSHTTSANKRTANLTLSHTTDALKRKVFSLTHSTSANKKRADNTLSHTTSANKRVADNLRTHLTDALKRTRNTLAHSTDTNKKKTSVLSHTTGSYLQHYPFTTTVVDNFNDNSINTSLWSVSGNATEVNGRAQLSIPVGATQFDAAYFQTNYSRYFNFVGQQFKWQIVTVPDNNQKLAYGWVTIGQTRAVAWQYLGGNLRAVYNTGTDTVLYTVAYSASVSWVRIRESAGTIYWDTSPDGVTWTNRATQVPSGTLYLDRVTAGFGLEGVASVTTVGNYYIDNVNIGGQFTRTHSTDSIKRKATVVSHTTSANKRTALTRSHTTSANKKKAANTLSHTTDSLVRRRLTLAHSTDSNKRKADNVLSHTTSANKKVAGNLRTHTTDALKRKIFTVSHITDALKRTRSTLSHTTGSVLRRLITLSHTTSANKRVAANTLLHNTDALKRAQSSLSHTTDTLKRKQFTRTHLTDALKRKVNSVIHTTNAFKRAQAVLSHTTSANKKKASVVYHNTNSYLAPNPVSIGNYYFDGSDGISDPNGYWGPNDADTFDASYSTGANSATSSSNTFGFLHGQGTTAPASNVATITQVRVRMFAQGDQDNYANFSPWVTLTVPTGGWTWQKASDLETKITMTPGGVKGQTSGAATVYTDGLAQEIGTTYWTATGGMSTGMYAWRVDLEVTYSNAASYTADHTTDSLKRRGGIILAHTTSALKRKSTVVSHTTSSNKKKVNNVVLHTTSANKRRLYALVHTTSANKKKANNVLSHLTDALKRTVFTKSHTTDSLKRIQVALSHTTDSFLLGRIALTHTADSFLRKINARTHSTSANKRKADNALAHSTSSNKKKADNTLAHLTDALKRKQFMVSHLTDALVRRQTTVEHTTSSNKRKVNILSHLTDANKRKATIVSHTTSANKRRAGVTLSHTTSANKKKANNVLVHTTNALKRTLNVVSHSTGSFLRRRIGLIHTTDSFLRGAADLTHSTDAVLRRQTTVAHSTSANKKKANNVVSHTTSALKRTQNTLSHTTDALKRVRRTISHTTDSFLRRRLAIAHSTSSLLRKQNVLSHATDSNKKKANNTLVHTTSANKRKLTFVSHSTDALKRTENILDHTTDSFLRARVNVSHSTSSVIRKANVVSHATDSFLRGANGIFHSTDANKKVAGKLISHSTSANKRVANNVLSHTTDTLKRTRNVLTHTADALKRTITEVSHATDSFLRKRIALTHSADSFKRTRNVLAHITDALVRKSNTVFHSTDANKKTAGRTVSHSTDANLRRAYTVLHSTDANKKIAGNLVAHSTSANKRKSDNAITHTTDAFKRIETVVAHSTDALIRISKTLAHSTDAFKRTRNALSHSTGAFIRKANALAHTTSANKRKLTAVSHTTSSNKRKLFTLTHTTSANKRRLYSLSHSTDANKRKGGNLVSHATSAVLRRAVSVSHSTSTVLRGINVLSHSTGSFLRKRSTASHTTDANKKKTLTRAHFTDAFRRNANGTFHVTSANLRRGYSESHDTDTLKRIERTVAHATDAFLRLRAAISHATDSFLRINETVDHTTDANKRKPVAISHTTDAMFRGGNERTHSTSANLRKAQVTDHSTDANRRKPEEIDHATDSFLRTRKTLSHSTDAYLRKATVVTHSTSANKRRGQTVSHATSANLKKSNAVQHATDASLKQRYALGHSTDSFLTKRTTVSHSTDANKKRGQIVSHSTSAVLGDVVGIAHTTDAYLFAQRGNKKVLVNGVWVYGTVKIKVNDVWVVKPVYVLTDTGWVLARQ